MTESVINKHARVSLEAAHFLLAYSVALRLSAE